MFHAYTGNLSIDLAVFRNSGGRMVRDGIRELLDENTVGVIVQNPGFFGCADDFTDIAELAHRVSALLILSRRCQAERQKMEAVRA